MLVLAAAAVLLTAPPASAASRSVDGLRPAGALPGDSADVSVDGKNVASGVSAKTVVGPLRLTAGKHVVALSSSGTPSSARA